MPPRTTSQAQLDAQLLRFAARGNTTGVQFALQYGADRLATDALQRTAAELAEDNGFTDVADWLVSLGVPRQAIQHDHVLAFVS